MTSSDVKININTQPANNPSPTTPEKPAVQQGWAGRQVSNVKAGVYKTAVGIKDAGYAVGVFFGSRATSFAKGLYKTCIASPSLFVAFVISAGVSTIKGAVTVLTNNYYDLDVKGSFKGTAKTAATATAYFFAVIPGTIGVIKPNWGSVVGYKIGSEVASKEEIAAAVQARKEAEEAQAKAKENAATIAKLTTDLVADKAKLAAKEAALQAKELNRPALQFVGFKGNETEVRERDDAKRLVEWTEERIATLTEANKDQVRLAKALTEVANKLISNTPASNVKYLPELVLA